MKRGRKTLEEEGWRRKAREHGEKREKVSKKNTEKGRLKGMN